MVAYCMEEFGHTEDAALKRIHVARTARAYPVLFEALDQGRLCMTAVSMLAPHLTAENVAELVRSVAGFRRLADLRAFLQRFAKPDLLSASAVEVAQSVAPERPTGPEAPASEPVIASGPADPAPPPDSLMVPSLAPERPTGPIEDPEWVELRIKVRRKKLQYAKELLSHSVPSGNTTWILDRALDAVIQKAEKRKFAACQKPRALRPQAGRRARTIPAPVRRAVWERDGGQCTFASDQGRRCAARYRLEFDHVVPVARGGTATVENLRLRCRGHNQYEAERVFGAEFMQKKRDEARVADAPAAESPFRADVIAGLRSLGVSARETNLVLERSGALSQATLQESMRAALQRLGAEEARIGLSD